MCDFYLSGHPLSEGFLRSIDGINENACYTEETFEGTT